MKPLFQGWGSRSFDGGYTAGQESQLKTNPVDSNPGYVPELQPPQKGEDFDAAKHPRYIFFKKGKWTPSFAKKILPYFEGSIKMSNFSSFFLHENCFTWNLQLSAITFDGFSSPETTNFCGTEKMTSQKQDT